MKYSAAILRKQNVRLAIAALLVAAQLPLFVVGAASANETNTAFTFTASYATDSHTSVENTANISIGNDTNQTAVSGDVSVDDVRSVGNIRTGDASNENVTEVAVAVANETNTVVALAADAPHNGHGHKRGASTASTAKVENTTNVHVYNATNQTAVSGDVSVDDVRSVGNIRTGDASNENCTSLQIVVAANALMTPRHSACAPTVPPVTPPVTPPTSDNGSVLGASTGGQGAGIATTAAQLANTGAEAIIGLFAGLSIIGTVSAAAYARRPIHN